jgi:hypothetical protein
MSAAVDRRTRAGVPLGPEEAVDPARALELFLGAPTAPGTMVRRVAPGAAADLCLLAVPLAAALHDPSAAAVRACWIGGLLAAGSP